MLTLVRVPDACFAFKRCRSQHPRTFFSFFSMVGLNFKRIACPACINFWTVGEGGENDRVREEGQEERWREDDPHSQNTHLSNAKLNFVLNSLWSIHSLTGCLD